MKVDESRAIKTTIIECINVVTEASLTFKTNVFRAHAHTRDTSVNKYLTILPDLFMPCSSTDIRSCWFAARAAVSTHTSCSNNKPALLYSTPLHTHTHNCLIALSSLLDSLQTRDPLTSYMAEVNVMVLHFLHRTQQCCQLLSMESS